MCLYPKLLVLKLIFFSAILCSSFQTIVWAKSTMKVSIFRKGAQPGHYLKWNGRPILLIGDSVTQGWMECGFNFDQRGYVDALASRGINLLMIWSYIATNAKRQQADSRMGYDAPEIWPWVRSPNNQFFDLKKFNQVYFERLKDLVAYAEKKKVIVLITIHDGWTKRRYNMHPFNEDLGNGPLRTKRDYVKLADYKNEMPVSFYSTWSRREKNQYFQERFCDKLISELNPYSNVIYEMFNEGEWYNRRRRNLHEQHFLTFFRAHCNNLLLTNTDHLSGDHPHRDPKVDVITLHGSWSNRFADFQKGFNKIPTKPYFMSEPVPSFNGNEKKLDSLRRMAWEITLAGAGWVNQNDVSFGWDPNTNIVARKTSLEKIYDYVGHCSRFFNNSGVNFSNMRPKGNLSSTRICMAKEGMEYVVYAPTGGKFTVNLSAVKGQPRIRWYNPRTGKFSGQATTTAKMISSFRAPDSNDWVLHIKDNR